MFVCVFVDVVCKVGDKLKAAVLYIDVAVHCVQLSLATSVIKAVQSYKSNKFTQVVNSFLSGLSLNNVKADLVVIIMKIVLVVGVFNFNNL